MKMIDFKKVQEKTGGRSRVTIWRWEKLGFFPKRRRPGPNSVAWLESEVDQWLENRPKAGSEEGK